METISRGNNDEATCLTETDLAQPLIPTSLTLPFENDHDMNLAGLHSIASVPASQSDTGIFPNGIDEDLTTDLWQMPFLVSTTLV